MRKRFSIVVRLCVALLMALLYTSVTFADFKVTNGRAIAAFKRNSPEDAYLMTSEGELLWWDDASKKWYSKAIATPLIRQMDCLGDGTQLQGTDDSNHIQVWDGNPGPPCPAFPPPPPCDPKTWSMPQGTTQYDWVMIDHNSLETRAQPKGLGGAWEEIAPAPTAPPPPTPLPWYSHLPAGPTDTGDYYEQRAKTLLLVDKTSDPDGYHRWQRGDTEYKVGLNKSGVGAPFKIFYFGENPDWALSRIVSDNNDTHECEGEEDFLDCTCGSVEHNFCTCDADSMPTDVVNPDCVLVRQISYDEVYQNLWCVDVNGVPWHWNNCCQGWEKRDTRSDVPYERPDEEPPGDIDRWASIKRLLREFNDYYIRTTYVNGEHEPRIIIFRETMILHLILGERGRANIQEIDIVSYAKKKDHKFHTILPRPIDTTQKIVRIDGTNRRRENHYLERLLQNHGIIAGPDSIGVYPWRHHVIRR